jgi:hypothetical protein
MGGIWTNGVSVRSVLRSREYPAAVIDWPDMGTVDIGVVNELVELCIYQRRRGRLVDIGCNHGHGRTGTLLACLIARVEHLSAEEAIAEVRQRYCRLAIEGKSQEKCVAQYVREFPVLKPGRHVRNHGAQYDKVTAMRQANPCATLEEIAKARGLTRERVRQLLRAAGLPTRHFRPSYVCLNCGKVVPGHRKQVFCNKQCRYEYHNPLIECFECGRLFRRKQSQLICPDQEHTHYFCSRHCNGIWVGKTYGWGRARVQRVTDNKGEYLFRKERTVEGKS